MNDGLKWLLTAGLGAGAMYFLDPARGRYRRALLRDRVQENWSPAARAVAGLAGGAAALYGFGRRGSSRWLFGAAGLALLGRAFTNLEMRRLFGVGVPRHAVEIQKTLRIHAPVEQVFGLWDDFENFPSFMTHVRRVRRLEVSRRDGARWRWTVRGPGGIESEFDAVVTAREENTLLAWRTEDGSLAQHVGRVQFRPSADGSTIVDVKMVYKPIAGAVGHAVAWLVGADPKHQMDDDLMRMKTFLETGKFPRDAAEHVAESSASGQTQTAPEAAHEAEAEADARARA